MDKSITEEVAIATITEPNEPYSPMIKASPITDFSKLNVTPKAYKVKLGKSIELKGEIDAVWISGTSSRSTAPTVTKGELVRLYKFKGYEVIMWEPLALNPDLTRQGTYTSYISNIKVTDQGTCDKTNTHYLDINTVTGILQAHLSNNNGEPAAVDITMDANKSEFILVDSIGNSITYNAAKGTIALDFKTDINLIAKNNINLEANNVNVKANKVKVTSPDTSMSGDVRIGGSLSVSSSIRAGGAISNPSGYVHRH